MTEPQTGRSRLLRAVTSLPGRVLITFALLALVARAIDWDQLEAALEHARWEFVLVAVALGVVSVLAGSLRWSLYLDALELGVPRSAAVQAYFVGSFSNIALPTGFGGDAVRTWLVGRSGVRLARAATSVVFDRLGALACLLMLAWLGVALEGADIPAGQVGLLAALTAAGVVAGALLVLVLRRRGLARFLPGSLRPWAREVALAVRELARAVRVQAAALALGLIAQAAVVGVVWALAETLSLSVSPGHLAVVTTLALVATLLPISLAGFGVREGAFVALLGAVGIGAANAALLSVLSVPTMALASLPGGIAMLLGQVSVAPPHDPDSPPPVADA